MQTTFYRITCLTNMHMGSGDALGVIDLEVERDPVLNEPTMNVPGEWPQRGGRDQRGEMERGGQRP